MSEETHFKLNIAMNTDALRDTDALAEVLMKVAAKVSQMMGDVGETAQVRDESGNPVGDLRFDDAPDYQVGDRDTTGSVFGCYDGEYFYDEDGDQKWTCSREADHRGIHAAGNGTRIVAVWGE